MKKKAVKRKTEKAVKITGGFDKAPPGVKEKPAKVGGIAKLGLGKL